MADEFAAQLAHLRELQEIDLTLHAIRLELSFLPQTIVSASQEYEAAKQHLDITLRDIAEAEKTKRTAELELRDSEVHLKERETKLYAIKTNKEYQAALKEIAEAKKSNRDREDLILKCMEQLEALTQQKAQLGPSFADKEKGYREAASVVKAKEEEFQQKLQEIESRRPSVAAKIGVSFLRTYETVRKRYPDAIVTVGKGICGGCSMNIPPQLYNEILRSSGLKTCPSCRRIIYAGSEGETAKGEKASSL